MPRVAGLAALSTVRTLIALPNSIPQGACTFEVPNYGMVAVYQIGSWWWAVYAGPEDTARSTTVGKGTSIVDALACLLVDERGSAERGSVRTKPR